MDFKVINFSIIYIDSLMIKNIKNNFTYYHTWNSFEQMLPSCWWSQKKIFGAILRSGLPQELNWITMPMSLCHHFFFPPFSVILERTPRLSASWKITAQWEELMAPCAVQCEFPLHINAIKLDLSSVKYTFLIFRKWSWTMQLVVMYGNSSAIAHTNFKIQISGLYL